MVDISSISEATATFLSDFPGSTRIKTIESTRGPYCCVMNWQGHDYYLVYKKEWFYSFSYVYRVSQKGIGQTFDMDLIHKAAKSNGFMVAVMSNGAIYSVPARDALEFILQHNTKRNLSGEIGEQGSIPAKMLTRVKLP